MFERPPQSKDLHFSEIGRDRTRVISFFYMLDRDSSSSLDESGLEELEKDVFGTESIVDRIKESNVEYENPNVSLNFVIDRVGADSDNTANSMKPSHSKKRVWQDISEETFDVNISKVNRLKKLRVHPNEELISPNEYEERLRNQYILIHGTPKWATKTPQNKHENLSDDESNDLLTTSGPIIKRSDGRKWGKISIFRCRDINESEKFSTSSDFSSKANSRIKCINFHPQLSDRVLISSKSHKLQLIKLTSKLNKVLYSFDTKKFPIAFSNFSMNGSSLIATSNKPQVLYHDLECNSTEYFKIRGRSDLKWSKFVSHPSQTDVVLFIGENGSIVVASLKNHSALFTLSMNGSCSDLCFNSDGSKLFSVGGEGQVYVWDWKNRRCENRFIDEGSLSSLSIAVSPNDDILAVGSSSGYVNIYEQSSILHSDNKTLTPFKSLKNLTTPINSLEFHPSGEILCISSKHKSDAVRLFDVKYGCTYNNFPASICRNNSLGQIQCISFSNDHKLLALGNAAGRAMLFKLNNFQSRRPVI